MKHERNQYILKNLMNIKNRLSIYKKCCKGYKTTWLINKSSLFKLVHKSWSSGWSFCRSLQRNIKKDVRNTSQLNSNTLSLLLNLEEIGVKCLRLK